MQPSIDYNPVPPHPQLVLKTMSVGVKLQPSVSPCVLPSACASVRQVGRGGKIGMPGHSCNPWQSARGHTACTCPCNDRRTPPRGAQHFPRLPLQAPATARAALSEVATVASPAAVGTVASPAAAPGAKLQWVARRAWLLAGPMMQVGCSLASTHLRLVMPCHRRRTLSLHSCRSSVTQPFGHPPPGCKGPRRRCRGRSAAGVPGRSRRGTAPALCPHG